MSAHRQPEAASSFAAQAVESPDSSSFWHRFAPALAGLAVCLVAISLWLALRNNATTLGGSSLAAWIVLVLGVMLGLTVLVTLSVVLERLQLSQELAAERAQRLIDPLTGLLNRQGITGEITSRLDAAEPGELIGVQFCDPDRLQVVNESLGHLAGDEILGVMAQRLCRLVRDGDAVGRFGADGFIVVTSGLPTVRDLEILGNRMVDVSRQAVGLSDGSSQVVTSSVGIAWTTDPDSALAEALVRDAAAAMSHAQSRGGGRVVLFDGALRAEAVDRLQIERDLRTALLGGDGGSETGLALHFQPIVALPAQTNDPESSSGAGVERVAAPATAPMFEALIRWDHPTRGALRPADFLPVAGESLLIVELGEMVLTEACRQAARWSELTGQPVSIAVNIAERQLLDLNLIDVVTRALAVSGLPARQLELEVTEELILERIDHAITVLRQLDLMGVRLAIDDFGTSQASLSRLKELTMVSTLKIDRSFIVDVATDPVDTKIVAAIVALAHSVGLSVVAEGVETEAQALVLRELGVGFAQGYLFGRPADAKTIEATLVPSDGRDRELGETNQEAASGPGCASVPAELS